MAPEPCCLCAVHGVFAPAVPWDGVPLCSICMEECCSNERKPEPVVISLGGPVDPVEKILQHQNRVRLFGSPRDKALDAFGGIAGLVDPPSACVH